MEKKMMKCELASGLIRYFNLDRVYSINEVQDGGLMLEFCNAKNEITTQAIKRFSIMKANTWA